MEIGKYTTLERKMSIPRKKPRRLMRPLGIHAAAFCHDQFFRVPLDQFMHHSMIGAVKVTDVAYRSEMWTK